MTALPPLRADLQLSPAAAEADGSPQWTLADPLRGRYFKIGPAAMRLLRHWTLGKPQDVLAAANREAGETLGAADLEQMLRFLRGHDLVSALDADQRAGYAGKAALHRQAPWRQLLHHYLFFRIPLWRPDAFLERTWPWLRRFGPGLLRLGLPLTLVAGIFLAARDWDRFVTSFPHLFSLGGLLAFGLALAFAKLCHEFGHAYMAKRAGCRVPSMGVAFMVLFPLFYTDVSDAWRVSDRRTRLLIGAGGVLAELLLAAVALLAWSLLPDGPARTAAFLLASATWLTTVTVNLNPFMRFDGYFLLSDLWGIDNLQARAFALCRWRLREALFGYGEPAPESWPPPMRRRLLAWGYSAWLWRAALFLAIALAVYHLFFKLLGVFLMLVELAWFIGLPVWRELREWWHRRASAHPGRALRSTLLLAAALLVLALPWRSSVEVPAVLEAERVSALHPPLQARLLRVAVIDGQRVEAGDLLVELEAPDLEARQGIVHREIRILQLLLQRQAVRSESAAEAGVLEERLATAVAEYRGLAAQRERLQLRAPHAGQVRDLMPHLAPGRWVASDGPLLRVVAPGVRLRGYLAETALARIRPGAAGHFIADDPLRPTLAVRLEEVDRTGTPHLELEALASDYRGPIAVRRDDQGRAQPIEAHYGVRLAPIGTLPSPPRPLRGVVRLEGQAESVLGAAWRRLAAIGVRESGF